MNQSDPTTSRRSGDDQPSAAPLLGLQPAARRWYAALAMVAAVALVLRLIYLWQLADSPVIDLLVGDALGYVRWGQRLAGGDWIGSDVFYQAPLYPYFLGVIQSLWSGELAGDIFVVRVIQLLLGVMGCVFLTLAGRAMFEWRTGVLAGLMLACYPGAIFFDGLIQKSALDLPLLCLALWLLVVGRQRQATQATSQVAQASQGMQLKRMKFATLGWWACAGVALALLMLSRENALVFVAAAGLWALLPAQTNATAANVFGQDSVGRRIGERLKRNDWRVGVLRCAVLLVALMLTLSPVIVRNYMVGGEIHLATSQFGSNLYIGNHPGADGSYQPLRYGRGDAAYERTDAIELAQERTGKTLSPGQVSSYWTGQVFKFMWDEPAPFVKLIWRKTMLMFNAVEMTDTEGQYAYGDFASLLVWLKWWNMGVLLPLAAAGLVLRAKDLRKMWLLPLCIVLYMASVIAFFVFARYRLPVVPLLMLVAAAGLVRVPVLLRNRDAKTVTRAQCVMLVAIVLSWWPMLKVNDQRAVSYASFARATSMTSPTGKPAVEDMKAFNRKAIELSPNYAAAYFNLGVLLLESGSHVELIEAVQAFEEAVQLKPDLADGWNQLGLARMRQGDVSGAIADYERALEARPSFAQAHNNIGVALARTGLLVQAQAHYQKAIAFEPGMAQAHNNLGTTLARQGDLQGAAASFEAALQLDPDYADAKTNLQKAQGMMRSKTLETTP